MKTMKELVLDKKGDMSLATMTGLALFLVILIITTSLGSQVVQKINDNVAKNSSADNVTTRGGQGLQQFAELAPVLGIVIISVIVLSTLKMLG